MAEHDHFPINSDRLEKGVHVVHDVLPDVRRSRGWTVSPEDAWGLNRATNNPKRDKVVKLAGGEE